MRLRWPFINRRKVEISVLPKALSMQEYREVCMGREVLLMAKEALKQTRFVPASSFVVTCYSDDGREYKVSVEAYGSQSLFEERRAK